MVDIESQNLRKARRLIINVSILTAFCFILVLLLEFSQSKVTLERIERERAFTEMRSEVTRLEVLTHRISLLALTVSLSNEGRTQRRARNQLRDLVEEFRFRFAGLRDGASTGDENITRSVAEILHERPYRLIRRADAYVELALKLAESDGTPAPLTNETTRLVEQSSELALALERLDARQRSEALLVMKELENLSVGIFVLTSLVLIATGGFVLLLLIRRLGNELKIRAQAERKLRVANEEISQFASIVAHDLKAPLNNIVVASSLYAKKVQDEVGKELVGQIHSEAYRLGKMIGALLKFSKLRKRGVKRESCSIANIIEECRLTFEEQLRAIGARIEYEELGTAYVDPFLISNVFQNLIQNAVKYRDKDRELVITISRRELSANKVEIVVSDNGRGIDPDHVEDIFEPFRRTPETQEEEGVGLGLTICKTIVERNGGAIRAESRLGKGTDFILELSKLPDGKRRMFRAT